MNRQRLLRILHKEFTRSPGKTAILLAMLPVAAYFIVPLFRSAEPKRAKVLLPSAVQLAPPAALTAAIAVPPGDGDDWRSLYERIQADPYYRPATVTAVRNPFLFPDRKEELLLAEESDADEESETQPAPRPPADLRLTGIVWGQGTRLATINGRTYAESDPIRAGDEGESAEDDGEAEVDVWVVAEITRRDVLLARGGTRHRLRLEQPERVIGISILDRQQDRAE